MKIIKTTDYKSFCQMVGANLRYCRNKKSLTQKSTGERIDITHQQVQKYEAGVSCCSAYRLDQMAKIYEVPVSELLNPDFIAETCSRMNNDAADKREAEWLEKDEPHLTEEQKDIKEELRSLASMDRIKGRDIYRRQQDGAGHDFEQIVKYEHERRILKK